MSASYDKSAAVVVLPPVTGGRLQNKSLCAWLSQSDLRADTKPSELLARVLSALGVACPEQGHAALRMWGQTSDRPAAWISAADAVYLEPRLDHLCLHSLRRVGVPANEMRALIEHLQTTLADDSENGGEENRDNENKSQFGFIRIGSYNYLTAQSPVETATVPAYSVDQQVPTSFMPSGDSADSQRKLIGEIEMALHDHPVNLQRIARGEYPVNSLWLWGGGTAPDQRTRPQPPLFSNDALLTGYWYSGTGVAEPWPGSIASCIEDSVAGFVAETPEFDDDPGLLESCLLELRAALRVGRLSKVTLLFRDGVRADIERSNELRFWRRNSELLR